jgi:hypothetical protein
MMLRRRSSAAVRVTPAVVHQTFGTERTEKASIFEFLSFFEVFSRQGVSGVGLDFEGYRFIFSPPPHPC